MTSFLQCIDAFVDELRWEEHDSAKRDKIHELKLTSEEWVRVDIFLGLLSVCLPLYIYVVSKLNNLQHADNAQQAFSSDNVPTLHCAIPALEALHRAWFSRAGRSKFQPFTLALHAACNKINEYCEKTTESPAHIMSMSMSFSLLSCTLDLSDISLVFNPKEKMGYFKKHWSAELQEEVLKCVEEEVNPSSPLSIPGANFS